MHSLRFGTLGKGEQERECTFAARERATSKSLILSSMYPSLWGERERERERERESNIKSKRIYYFYSRSTIDHYRPLINIRNLKCVLETHKNEGAKMS